ncbi:hypothetical protein TcasGA2_TC005300, partial [Tribolium castaneum]
AMKRKGLAVFIQSDT